MKEKNKKVLLWIILILFAVALTGSIVEIIMLSFGLSEGNLFSNIVVAGISWLVIAKLRKKLNVPSLSLSKRDKPKD